MYLLTKNEKHSNDSNIIAFLPHDEYWVSCSLYICLCCNICHSNPLLPFRSSWLRWSPADTLRYVTIACQKSQRNVNKWSPSKIEESFEIKVASTLKDLNEAWVPQEKMKQNESCMDQTFCCTSGEPFAKGWICWNLLMWSLKILSDEITDNKFGLPFHRLDAPREALQHPGGRSSHQRCTLGLLSCF